MKSFTEYLRENNIVLPNPVLKAFLKLGDDQRGRPEQAMLKVQFAMGGGVLNPVVEHIGDITHRMTHGLKWGRTLQDNVFDKVDKVERWLSHSYGFQQEYDENIKNNARYNEVPEDVFRKKVERALELYAKEHSRLKVYNEAQWLAREAAVAVGERHWSRAVSFLKALQRMERDWDTKAVEYTLDSRGNPVEYKG